MRSREEQIIHLGARLFVGAANLTDANCEAQRMIDEAERRAEQRVRAEIGRDSDRLGWLAAQILRVRAHAPYQPIIINGTYDPGELRDAIDDIMNAENSNG